MKIMIMEHVLGDQQPLHLCSCDQTVFGQFASHETLKIGTDISLTKEASRNKSSLRLDFSRHNAFANEESVSADFRTRKNHISFSHFHWGELRSKRLPFRFLQRSV